MLRPVSGEGERADAACLSVIMGFCGYIGEKMLHGILTPLGHSATSLQHDYAMIMRRTPSHPLMHGRNTSPMAHTDDSAIWVQKGATLSEKRHKKSLVCVTKILLRRSERENSSIVTILSMAIPASNCCERRLKTWSMKNTAWTIC